MTYTNYGYNIMTEIKNLKNGNLVCIETENYLDNYLLYWYILIAELTNGHITRIKSTVTKPH